MKDSAQVDLNKYFTFAITNVSADDISLAKTRYPLYEKYLFDFCFENTDNLIENKIHEKGGENG